MKHIPTWEEYQQKLIRDGLNFVEERLKEKTRQEVARCLEKVIPNTKK